MEVQKDGVQPDESSAQVGGQEQESKSKTISHDDHKRALDDMHKYKQQAREYEAQLNELKKSQAEAQESRLHEKQEFKTLYEQKAQKVSELEGELNNWRNSYFEEKKIEAFRQEALKAGMYEDVINDVIDAGRLDLISLEKTDQGRVIVHGAAEQVEEYRKNRPIYFKKAGTPMVNAGGAGIIQKEPELTPQYVLSLEKKWKVSRSEKDRATYIDALERYKRNRA